MALSPGWPQARRGRPAVAAARSPSRIQVFTVATGSQREWTWPGGGYITNNAGGGRVAVLGGRRADPGLSTVAGTQHLRRRARHRRARRRPQSSTRPVEFAGQAVDSARGPTILNGFRRDHHAGRHQDRLRHDVALAAHAAHGTRLHRVLGEHRAGRARPRRTPISGRHHRLQTEDVLWTNASGGTLIVSANARGSKGGPAPPADRRRDHARVHAAPRAFPAVQRAGP